MKISSRMKENNASLPRTGSVPSQVKDQERDQHDDSLQHFKSWKDTRKLLEGKDFTKHTSIEEKLSTSSIQG
ncbi:hypothetical protein SUGI_0951240 [Cryptomeria japonica]|nr:hypothetical protein SUGI_0951240 [Cryptomeria japonica]